MERFSKGETGNTGIGLAIVKQICELYGFKLTYTIENVQNHCLSVSF